MSLKDKRSVHKKMQIANDLFVIAYETKKHQYRKKFPHLSEKELNLMAYASIERGSR